MAVPNPSTLPTRRQGRLQAAWLPALMQGSFSEICVLDSATLRVLETNASARRNLQYSADELAEMTPLHLARNLDAETLAQVLAPLKDGRTAHTQLETQLTRKDGSSYPAEIRFLYCADSEPPVFIGISNDTSDRLESARALQLSEERIRAIVSNTPGLVYQFLQRPDGSVTFPYLSKGCHALLGISAERLRADPSLLLQIILPEDRPFYLRSMETSASALRAWNWEGRIWIEKWKDIKWINLRSTPHTLPDGSVQWEGIMTNITQSKLEQAEIRRSRQQLAELSAHVDTVKEKERTRIAREIHDDLGGNLTAIKMALALLKRRLPSDPLLTTKAEYVDALVDRTIEAIHRIVVDLRPSILDFGIVAAIDWQAKEFEKQLGIPCEFDSNRKEIGLDLDQATALFRIFQEALTNIGKHAQASRVSVCLTSTRGNVKLEVNDNGRGIGGSEKLKPKSFGIRGMVERASALGGRLSVNSPEGGGTCVTVQIPIANASRTSRKS